MYTNGSRYIQIVRYVFKIGDPPVTSILLVESGSRHLLEKLIPTLRQTWGDAIPIDLVTCYNTLPSGFDPATTRLYCVTEYRGRELRPRLYKELLANHYSYVGIVCSDEALMTKWKWALAWQIPAKLFIINENADFFWFSRSHWRVVLQFVLYRSGLAGTGAVRMLSGVILFPFTLFYLLLYATAVHTRRILRSGDMRRS
jgi:hypothetical protein